MLTFELVLTVQVDIFLIFCFIFQFVAWCPMEKITAKVKSVLNGKFIPVFCSQQNKEQRHELICGTSSTRGTIKCKNKHIIYLFNQKRTLMNKSSLIMIITNKTEKVSKKLWRKNKQCCKTDISFYFFSHGIIKMQPQHGLV